MVELRDTAYAREIRSASMDFRDGSQGRIELLYVKSSQQEEIRFSWWRREGQLILRPLDLPEDPLHNFWPRQSDKECSHRSSSKR